MEFLSGNFLHDAINIFLVFPTQIISYRIGFSWNLYKKKHQSNYRQQIRNLRQIKKPP